MHLDESSKRRAEWSRARVRREYAIRVRGRSSGLIIDQSGRRIRASATGAQSNAVNPDLKVYSRCSIRGRNQLERRRATRASTIRAKGIKEKEL